MADFFGKLKSGAGKVAFEADKMARLNHAQGELGQLKKQSEAFYIRLGELTYRQHMNQEAESPEVGEICQSIGELEQQINLKNEEVQRINAETYNPQGQTAAPQPPAQPAYAPAPQAPVAGNFASAPIEALQQAPAAAPAPASELPTSQSRFCPNCGKEQPATIKFCTDCGTKLA